MKKERFDPFSVISEKEILWAETNEVSKEVRADVKGKASDKTLRETYRGMSAEDVKKMWEDFRARKKRKTLKKPGE